MNILFRDQPRQQHIRLNQSSSSQSIQTRTNPTDHQIDQLTMAIQNIFISHDENDTDSDVEDIVMSEVEEVVSPGILSETIQPPSRTKISDQYSDDECTIAHIRPDQPMISISNLSTSQIPTQHNEILSNKLQGKSIFNPTSNSTDLSTLENNLQENKHGGNRF